MLLVGLLIAGLKEFVFDLGELVSQLLEEFYPVLGLSEGVLLRFFSDLCLSPSIVFVLLTKFLVFLAARATRAAADPAVESAIPQQERWGTLGGEGGDRGH